MHYGQELDAILPGALEETRQALLAWTGYVAVSAHLDEINHIATGGQEQTLHYVARDAGVLYGAARDAHNGFGAAL